MTEDKRGALYYGRTMRGVYKMKRVLFVSILFSLTLIMIGCATTQKVEQPRATVFYPSPPDLPRMQFLVSFTGAGDLGAQRSAFEAFVTGEKEDASRLDKPYGVAIHDGKIYVCDTNRTVMVFDLVKRTFLPLQGAQGMGKLLQPLNIFIDDDGNKYVTDPVREQVVLFDKNDFYVGAFGTPGEWKPVDAVFFDGRLYVADIKNAQIVVFDKTSGKQVDKFGQKGDPAERLYLPTNLAFNSDGMLYVSDVGKFQVVKFDRDGHYRGAVGSLGTTPGHFARPKGLATDKRNRLYIVDAAFDNVQMFDKEGDLLLFFGHAGKGPGDLFLPAKVAVDYDNLKYFQQYVDPNFELEHIVLVTSQFGNHMVNVYGYGKQKGATYPSDEELIKEAKEKMEKLRKEQSQKPEAAGEQEKK